MLVGRFSLLKSILAEVGISLASLIVYFIYQGNKYKDYNQYWAMKIVVYLDSLEPYET